MERLPSPQPTADALRATVAALCSQETAGRAPGSPQGRAARQFIIAEMEDLGLQPGAGEGLEQAVGRRGAANVLGALPGDGDRWVLLAAHYDHLGRWGRDTYWGANDNASGVAVMLEVASRLAGTDVALGRNVLFCAFDAEEPPHFLTKRMGSQWFVDHPTIDLDRIDLMICLDIVGSALGPEGLPGEVRESIFVQGAETSGGTSELIAGLPAVDGIRVRRLPDWLVPPLSDHDAFRTAGIPWVFYTVGRDARYHTPDDTPDRLDFAKMAALAGHLEHLVVAAAEAGGPRPYLAEPGPDVAAIDDLVAVLGAMATLDGAAAAASEMLRSVRAASAAGHVPPEARDTVRAIVLGLEQQLGGA